MKAETQAQVKSMLDFAAHLVASTSRSRDARQAYPDPLLYINILPFPPADISKPQKIGLRDHATKIWNFCNHLATSDDQSDQADAARFRAFACLILTSIVASKTRNFTAVLNLFSNILVTGKACLKAKLVDLAEKILRSEVATTVLDMDKAEEFESCDTPPSLVEYYCLRGILDWKRGRLDLTDHWYKLSGEARVQLKEQDVEKIADLCYEIGLDCLSKGNEGAASSAVVWLGRALAMLDHQCHQHFFAGSDLRLSIMHRLVQALARLPDYSSHEKAQEVLGQLKSEYGPKLPILLLSLEVVHANIGSGLDIEACGVQIEELIRSVHLIDANHRLIMHYVQQLSNDSHHRASDCLKVYIVHRLIPEERFEWYEQAIVNRVAMASSSSAADQTAVLQNLEQDLNLFADTCTYELCPGAAQAAHALVWKMIHETDIDSTRSLAMLWCQVGLHRIFNAAGEAGCGKLERQLISYHLLVSNTGLAQQMLEQMSFMQKNNRSSRYLAYCVAVRSGNDADAQSCLNTITNGQGDNDQLLFACIGESIKHGTSLDTARLALRLLEKQMQDNSPNADLGVLLQYTAKMFLQVVAERAPDHIPDQEVPAKLCWIFKHAVRLHNSCNSAIKDILQPKIEVYWFQQSSFDMAIAHIKTWPKRYIIDLLDYCRLLCEPRDGVLVKATQSEKSLTRLRECSFLQAILYAAEARSVSGIYSVEDMPESSYDSRSKPKTSECREVLHRNVFRIFTTLQKQFTEIETFDSSRTHIFKSQLHVLMPLAFEALLFLSVNSWLAEGTSFDEVSIHQFLQTVNDLELPIASYAVLADTLLAFATDNGERGGLRVPRTTAASLLNKIIQALRKAPSYNMEQAARWIRCVAQLIFEDIEAILVSSETKEPLKTTQRLGMLDSLIQQAINLAKAAPSRSKQEANVKAQREIDGVVKNFSPYPEEELQWLVSKMWNMAIDLFSVEQYEMAKSWAGKAVQMAEVGVEGEGNMAGVVDQLKDNIKRLGWDI